MDSISTTARRINELRDGKALSRRALAESLEVSPQTIGRWETGEREPSASEITKIASFFGCEPNFLLGVPNRDHSNHSEQEEADADYLIESVLQDDLRGLGEKSRELTREEKLKMAAAIRKVREQFR